MNLLRIDPTELWDQQHQLRVEAAVDSIDICNFPMHIMRLTNFRAAGHIEIHESARKGGRLHVLDTVDDAKDFGKWNTIVFVSHQWLGWSQPDGNNVHYKAALHALDLLIDQHAVDPDKT